MTYPKEALQGRCQWSQRQSLTDIHSRKRTTATHRPRPLLALTSDWVTFKPLRPELRYWPRIQ